MRIGFVGLGNMGRHMVRNLMEGGHELVVHDLVAQAARPALDAGARWSASPRELAEQCRIVMVSLPGPPEVEAVLLGENGVLAGARPGDIFVDLSTNSPTVVRRLAEIAGAKGVQMLDAPVSGGTVGAEKGTLSIMIGGDEATFRAVEPALSCIGKSLFFLGPIGCGSIAKLMNNMIGLTSHTVISEAMVLGVKAGMDAQKLWEVIMASTGRSVAFENLKQTVLGGNFEPGFMVDLGAKDLTLATGLARELKVPAPTANVALQRYVEAQARGLGRKACPAIITMLEEVAGVQVRASKGS
ncbi:MAG: NAD(P)-dependent oxidoreductase [Bacteroidetes bacterium]|nr:NAD(P)-dependent oxidoreductase [Bacteroidota bacterium]MCL5026325.1 NAD(P)-dependent oxidoreductase [Chloroflexota bacterium]